MRLAKAGQSFQDWFTQQWAIFWGKKIEPDIFSWLIGPFGKPGAIADEFVKKIAEDEGLIIERNVASHGLIPSIKDLKLSDSDYARLSQNVINFYEKTALYKLSFSVKWHPLFKIFGKLINYLFSNRIEQLNIPTNNVDSSKQIKSEIITLSDPETKVLKYTVWYRTFMSTGQVLYSGVYTTCTLPSGKVCVKAVFPLPNGNATVILSPTVGPNGELCLDSSGKKFGDPGFYFLLHDSKGDFWSHYISSFRDQLIVCCVDEIITAEQRLTLWHRSVLRFRYEIHQEKFTHNKGFSK